MKNNVYQIVTNRIIEQLKQGVIPWHKPWTGIRTKAFNRISRKPYSLLNQMLLKHDGEYASFKQWTELGGKIRKGEKAEIVVFWKILEVEKENNDGELEKKTVPYLRYVSVFHISQVDGVKPLEEPFHEVEPIADADKVILDYVTREAINFNEQASNEAYYSPSRDTIVVPMKEQYQHINEYYSTTFHELVHSTGHKNRLNRLETTAVASFGSETYSKEELVAEIGSATILSTLEIETKRTFTNSVAYIQNWLNVLKNDNRFIISASSQAEKAVDYILA
ncbi:zincin-like metallopeptidase domain-containing protein [Mediterraneibacter faecis]|jgi:antirestriction protein ArdC|uniref:ArdC family protein n=1 Tax=Mediterraneibacter faecis TaxID=592978 RepID=UPI001EDFA87B|nr:zincin-like metallopeptidase domain-containing protein [Mediterraneibacter faecis]MCG4530266.1 zincin-like metallopeptidase domain-containing protein [Mediterraneibacter faecis]MCG4536445.1 zincin-like metallopeptidase domain-containing protein [Mediterraneibacter faecis]MCG4538600.1 zincin-like metallopeptidase domain-containing protein [Mediterraneibacter faecis]MCG4547601.1 zincin-like metallopeptidase domain-containing protein [Mediterraneibacter faecis]MCG4550116.1 zincin-like metallop